MATARRHGHQHGCWTWSSSWLMVVRPTRKCSWLVVMAVARRPGRWPWTWLTGFAWCARRSGRGQTRPRQAMPDEARPRCTMAHQLTPEATRPGQTNPDQTRPDEARPSQTRPDQARAGQNKPELTRPEQARPDQTRRCLASSLPTRNCHANVCDLVPMRAVVSSRFRKRQCALRFPQRANGYLAAARGHRRNF